MTDDKHVCAVCKSDKTVLRMNKKPRWHQTSEDEFLCHRCYMHSLDYKHPDEPSKAE